MLRCALLDIVVEILFFVYLSCTCSGLINSSKWWNEPNVSCFTLSISFTNVFGFLPTGENFAVFRSTSGEVYVLDAYCPHLGANMAIGGVVRGECLECPFHAWQFSGQDGKCSHIPYTDKGKLSYHIMSKTFFTFFDGPFFTTSC